MGTHKQILFIGEPHCHGFLSKAITLLNPDTDINYFPGIVGALLHLTEVDRRKFPRLIIVDLDTTVMNAGTTVSLIRSIPSAMNTVILFLSKNLESWDIVFWEEQGITLFEKPFTADEYSKVAQTVVYSLI